MRRIVRRRAGAIAAAVATFVVLATPLAHTQSLELAAGPPPPCDQASPAELEQVISDIHTFTNRARAAALVAPVERLDRLDRIAQDWTPTMAADDKMRHNPDIRADVTQTFPGEWRGFSENVLQNWCGATGEALVQQWMSSPTHRANLLDPEFTHMGVGAEVAASKKLYSTQDFVSLY